MIIEWLKFEVAPDLREQHIQIDEEVWTATLKRYPGFLSKQVWLDPDRPHEVILIINWADCESWRSVPANVLEATEKEFARRFGADQYKLIEAKEFHIRKFPT
jgi:uncharacterized protein (TIGR03792 family)